jgi:regulator of RNase E activity RraA
VADAGGIPLPPGLAAVGRDGRLVGFARTVHLAPGDNLGLQALAVQARPGDVIVAVGGGDRTALVGELLCLRAAVRGAAGFIVDGYVRDREALALPVFARGTQPRRPARRDFVAIDEPVELLTVPVRPGDLVLADPDGIVVVPAQDLEPVLARLKAVQAADGAAAAAVLAGEDLAWLDAALAARKGLAGGSPTES